MPSMLRFHVGRLLRLGVVLSTLGAVAACGFNDPLRIEDPSVLTGDELSGTGAVSATINGIVGAFHEAYDDYVRYACMFTDECILAGTFPSRVEVDDRRILPSNVSLDDEIYEDVHTARFLADKTAEEFPGQLQDPELESVRDLLWIGIAAGKLYGAYSRVLLAELYCESALDAGPYLLSDARMAEALNIFQEAEQAAADAAANVQSSSNAARAGDLGSTAIVGQARAHLWLGQYTEADADAARVPAGFDFFSEYSENDNATRNELHSFSWGLGGQVIRWTVGDGSSAERNRERFPYFVEWVTLDLIDSLPGPAFVAFNSAIPVKLQLAYRTGASPMLLASKAEADMIQAEVAIREGRIGDANTIVNGYRAGWIRQSGPDQGTPLPAIDFAAVGDLNGDGTANGLQDQLWQFAQEKNRELWLTGERQATLRRFRVEFGINTANSAGGLNMWGPISATSFDQIWFPVPDNEFDANLNQPNAQCVNFQ